MKEEFLMEQNENTENERETVSSEEEKLDKELDEILADVLRFSQKKDSENAREETEETVTTPAFSVPEPEQEDPLVSMTVQMKALTEEIRLLRTQLAETHRDGEPEEKAQEIPDICGEPKPAKKNRVLHILGNAVFYLVMIGIVIGALAVKSGSSGQPVMVAGFSAFRVLTSSMEDVYPKGSLIISKKTDPDALAVGDDITFMISSTSSVTHRIIGITENYLGTGEPGFETQGIMNEKPDKDMVAAANVIGKVIFCSKFLGDLVTYIQNNWPLLVFAAVVVIALIVFLKWNAQRDDGEEQPKKDLKSKKTQKH